MKPLKDTKLGSWLSEKAPKIFSAVGEVLPEKGVLGIIRNIIHSDPDLTTEQKLEFEKMEHDFETEIFSLEIQDKDSARKREQEFVKVTGHMDWMQTAVGVLVMSSFLAALVLIGFKEIPSKNEHLMINAIGIMEGLVLSVVSYYYGSSAGSRLKDMKGK